MKDYFKKNILYKNLYWAARCIVIKKKEPKQQKTMFFSFFFVRYKKTCVMGQNDAYMNQDRETKEKTTDVGKRGVWVCFPSLKRKRWFCLPGALFASKKVCSPPLHLSLSLLLAGFLVSATLAPSQCCTGCRVRNSEGWKG